MSIFSFCHIPVAMVLSMGFVTSPCVASMIQNGRTMQQVGPNCDKIYFDPDEMPMGEDAFHIHMGENIWIKTSAVHRDVTGFFTFTDDIYCLPGTLSYEKQWKCPYCNYYWPMGKPCGNPDCPSRFK